jgi:hypothetical protein
MVEVSGNPARGIQHAMLLSGLEIMQNMKSAPSLKNAPNLQEI